jgi:hypothetical protein
LERIQLVTVGHTFDSQDSFLVRLKGQKVARAHGSAIDQHGAGTADFGFAGSFRPGEAQTVSQKLEQSFLDRDVARPTLSIDGKR